MLFNRVNGKCQGNKFMEKMVMMKKLFQTTISVVLLFQVTTFANQSSLDSSKLRNNCKKEMILRENEKWWGGFTTDGKLMPFGSKELSRDLYANNKGNQAQPLLISNKGRYVWSEEPFKYTFKAGKLILESEYGEILTGQYGNTLREVFLYVSSKFFPSNGKIPDAMFFTHPQYNTWIELMYDQREDYIRKYANDILTNGFPPGMLMIDDIWAEDYGVWDFHPGRFNNPKDLIDSLHRMGFKVMLWIVPFVSADSATSRFLAKNKLLLKNNQGDLYLCGWWNGYSTVLDFTNDSAIKWFKERLNYLQGTYGVDGFKFDGGDARRYKPEVISAKPVIPNRHTELWALLGADYPVNEYRACWKAAGLPLVQRLRDKNHSWEGIQQLIPDALALGLLGYAYICPDMIGGGNYTSFLGPDARIDQEMIVRSAQCAALMPMMQFSVAPWRVLNKKNMNICLDMAKLHVEMGPEILALAKQSSKTGEPIIRHLEYMYPNQGYANIKDEFMLGDSILVTPVLEKGKTSRKVIFPKGTWIGDDGSEVVGPCEKEISVPIERLPWYRLKGDCC